MLTSLPVITTNNNTANNNSSTIKHEYISPIIINEEDDISLYAKSLLDLGEYEHAASILSMKPNTNTHKKQTSHGIIDSKSSQYYSKPLPNLTSYGIFIRGYALYLAGEQRKEEEFIEVSSSSNNDDLN